MNYKSILTGLLIWVCGSILLADLPGGYNMYSALFSVRDAFNNPLSGKSVKLVVRTYTIEDELHIVNLYGTTNSQGSVYLETLIPPELSESLYDMQAYVIVGDPDYSIGESSNTWTNSQNYLNPYFKIVYDLDKDLVDDNLEQQLAEKFSPVLHKHSHDEQAGLQNFENLITQGAFTLKVYNSSGTSLHTETLSAGDEDLHKWDIWHWDTYGHGSLSTGNCKLSLNDSYRYTSAPIGQRPIYYHVYRDGGYYYVQYWYYFTMDDKTGQLGGAGATWHESDWEHVTLRVVETSPGIYEPDKVNFYQHEGGETKNASACYWSSTNSTTYNGIGGYSSTNSHLHIWIGANGHASYSRYAPVYHIYNLESFATYQDRVDYSPYGYDLYFEYDYLVKLGEISESFYSQCPNSNCTLTYHRYPRSSACRSWLAFIGRCGDNETPFYVRVGHAPTMPSEGSTHEWLSFTVGNPRFGNEGIYQEFELSWVTDDYTGD